MKCDTFEAFVSLWWPGHANGTSYSACYSSWGKEGNIVRNDSVVAVSSLYNSHMFEVERSVDGYACCFCRSFLTNKIANSYWQLDMLTPIKVHEVIVAIRKAEHFDGGVRLHLGNSTSYSSNPVFAVPVTSNTSETGLKIVPSGNVAAGRYLTVLSPSEDYLGFSEIQVIVD